MTWKYDPEPEAKTQKNTISSVATESISLFCSSHPRQICFCSSTLVRFVFVVHTLVRFVFVVRTIVRFVFVVRTLVRFVFVVRTLVKLFHAKQNDSIPALTAYVYISVAVLGLQFWSSSK